MHDDGVLWMVVACSYKNGYLRTSSEEFSTSLDAKGNRHNKMVHLTNYCMQKHSKNLGKFEEGNTLSYAMWSVTIVLLNLARQAGSHYWLLVQIRGSAAVP